MPEKPPIFIGGAGRSGTTLIRVILDSHSSIACGPELKIGPELADLWHRWQTAHAPTLRRYELTAEDVNAIFAQLFSSLLKKLRLSSGKQRVAEKTPNNVFFFAHLNQIFPDSPLVHVVRDGRDVVCSLLTMDWKTPDGEPVPYTRSAAKAAHYWANAVTAGRTAGAHPSVASRYLELKYEEIVEQPEITLRRLFAHLEEPWEPAVLKFSEQKRDLAGESSAAQVSRPLYRSARGRWQRDLSAGDKEAIHRTVTPLLMALGYEQNESW